MGIFQPRLMTPEGKLFVTLASKSPQFVADPIIGVSEKIYRKPYGFDHEKS